MKKTRYLNIHMDGEKNIGVVKVVVTEKKEKDKSITTSFNLLGVEQKVITALKEHFNCPVTTLGINANDVGTHPTLDAEMTVFLKGEDEDTQATVFLEEIYVY